MLVLIFDVDDTLYSQIEPFSKAYKQLFGNTDIDMEKLYQRSRYYSDLKFEESRKGCMTMEDYHSYRIRKALKDFGVIVSYEEGLRFQKLYADNQKKIEVTKPTEQFLNFIKDKNIKLAIITNGPSDHQWNKIYTLKLSRWFSQENIFVSYDIGYNKPDKQIFNFVSKKMHLTEDDEIYYIGDSFDNDIIGARKVNWQAIWLNRRKVKPSEKLDNFLEVSTDEELVDYLYKIVEKY